MFSTLTEKAIVIILMILAIIFFVLFERHEGAQGCIQSDTQAGVKQEVSVAAATAAAVPEVKKEAADERQAIAVPVVNAPVVRVCPPPQPSHPSEVLQPAAAGPATPESSAVPAASVEVSAGPIIEVGRDADAQVNGLLAYIHNVCHG